MKNLLENSFKWATFLILIGAIVYFLVTLSPSNDYYEVHGADGKIYHTTSISHGTNRIWFTDEGGSRIELGGGYTVIKLR